MPRDLEVRVVERPTYSEYHLTASSAGEPLDASPLLAQAYALCVERGVSLLHEKFYGDEAVREPTLATRGRHLQRRGIHPGGAVSWVEGGGARAGAAGFFGFQLWGVGPGAAAGAPTPSVVAAGDARIWTAPGFRLALLPQVDGLEGGSQNGVTAQAGRMFDRAATRLDALELSYEDVIRTWIYAPRLLDWYGELNRARSAHHAERAPGGDLARVVFPASTGIQGRCGERACFMDVLALRATRPDAVRFGPVRDSEAQGAAFAYGSSFSRGMWLDCEGQRTVYVSGTASIDGEGVSVHLGEPEGQVFQTLLSVAAVLRGQGLGLRDICTATVFCKSEAALDAWLRVTDLLEVAPFPAVLVKADVCRPELLLEIEAVAAGPAREAL